MRLGTALLMTGIIVAALGGLEKVLVFTALADKTMDLQTMKNLTPPYIWTITNVTFWSGVVLAVFGLFCFLDKSLKKAWQRNMAELKKRNAEFEAARQAAERE